MDRCILHIDMDAFFVSVEEVLDPSLKGKAVIVGGVSPRMAGKILKPCTHELDSSAGISRPGSSVTLGGDPHGRGVVAAASYEARKFGVHSAMPIGRAKRLCPHAVFLRGAHKRYSQFSARIFKILRRVSPLVEGMSLDEAYIDFTGCERLHGPAPRAAQRLRDTIHNEVGIRASIGIASNKLMAKVASNLSKPNGMLRILPGREASFLAPYPIGVVPGIGPKSVKQFQRMGIKTVVHLAALPRELLEEVYGEWGGHLYQRARGLCTSPVVPEHDTRSISRETTLDEDSIDPRFLEGTLSYLVEKAAAQLREEGLRARCITLKLRYSDFKTVTRSRTLETPACEDAVIFDTVVALFRKLFVRRTRVRLVGVALTSLVSGPMAQMDLFEHLDRGRWDRLYAGIDRIRSKYGFHSILRATSYEGE